MKPFLPRIGNKILYTGFIQFRMYPLYIRVLLWLFGIKDCKHYFILLKRIINIEKHSGKKFLCMYLKYCYMCLRDYISGNPKLNIEFPIKLTKYGIPMIIPGPLRKVLFLQVDPVVIRMLLSIFSIYRVLKVPGKLNIETITNIFSGLSLRVPQEELDSIWGWNRWFCKPIDLTKDWIPRYSAGPNTKRSCLGGKLDCIALIQCNLLKPLLIFLYRTSNFNLYNLLLKEVQSLTKEELSIPNLKLGKLSTKLEAAGKVRVFAIVDMWTQSALQGLHDELFFYLKKIKQDGTFDQLAPLKLLRESIDKDTKCFSFDISAATDRIPVDYLVQILSKLIGEQLANLWKEILVNRDYFLSDKRYGNHKVRYSVGQPMGALSSWAMLAIGHHWIVQMAAFRCGYSSWFTKYALLGDDIVIADEAVANQYLFLMKYLGVEINLSKSVISPKGCVEFAKQFSSPEFELSPIGPKAILLAIHSPTNIVGLMYDYSLKGYLNTSEAVLNLFKERIPLVKENSVLKRDLMWTLIGPFGLVPTSSGLADNLKLSNTLTGVDINTLLTSIDDVLYELTLKEWDSAVRETRKSIISLRDHIHLGHHSPSLAYLLELAEFTLAKLVLDKPERRWIFDAPNIFSGIYLDGFYDKITKYIFNKIKAVIPVIGIPNPLLGDLAVQRLPSPTKNRLFFTRVRQLWIENRGKTYQSHYSK